MDRKERLESKLKKITKGMEQVTDNIISTKYKLLRANEKEIKYLKVTLDRFEKELEELKKSSNSLIEKCKEL